ncbi:glycosyl hydrolase family 18 protein [Fictibacillus sp. FJAT-27399]|uniref:glycosyl hydrolase family 18 protein n=1 Tax=Fictibacillus sp. FJAT-27399 TaxID=1729689 RepID=UPI00350F514E
MDIPPDSNNYKNNNNAPFNHTILGKYCDFVVFMGYDEHWSTDPIPGPVTSRPWLKDSIVEFIETGIPTKKIILGLPSYTRIWKRNQSGHIIRNPAFSAKYVENWLSNNHRSLK